MEAPALEVASAGRPAAAAAALARYLSSAADGRAWLSLLYLLVRLPVAVFLAVLWAIGIGTGLGIVSVALWLLLIWVAGKFERGLAAWWLRTPLTPQRLPQPPGRGIWRRIRDFYGESVLWKTVAWTLIQIPTGLIAFALFTGLLSLALALVSGPALYLGQAAAGASPLNPAIATAAGTVLPAPLLVLSIVAGLLMIPGILRLARAAGDLESEVAQALLGVGATKLQLAESRARAEAERARAEHSEQSRRQLIVNVSHELRNPIASIRGHVDSLLDAGQGGSPEDTRRYLEVVARETERLGALADDLLAAAQGDAGELRLVLAPVAAGECVRQVADTMAPLAARERSVTIVHEVEEDSPEVLADRDRLVQVLANLVRNAIKYTPEGGIVSLRARRAEAAVEVLVSDTGIGIAPAELERIFERFYRTDASRSRATGGFGLGLAISRDLVEAMGGSITAGSVEGQGSTFTVRLRVAR